jgi:hypothetical protein
VSPDNIAVECERSASILRNNVEPAVLEALLAGLPIKEFIMCAAVDWKILFRVYGISVFEHWKPATLASCYFGTLPSDFVERVNNPRR